MSQSWSNPNNLRALPGYECYGAGASSLIPVDEKGNHYQPGDEDDKHFRVAPDPFVFWFIDERSRGNKLFQFRPPERLEFGSILYLPYHPDCITSISIPTTLHRSVRYFVTDSMSGCNFFVDQGTNGDLVCYHGNAKRYSPEPAAVKEDPAAMSPLAERTMEAQHRRAQVSECPDVTRQTRLQARHYYAEPKARVEYERDANGREKVEFFGGSTIMGFRVNNQWQFWYQTFGRITWSGHGISSAPVEIFDAQQFW